jgi:hypothetical protein
MRKTKAHEQHNQKNDGYDEFFHDIISACPATAMNSL